MNLLNELNLSVKAVCRCVINNQVVLIIGYNSNKKNNNIQTNAQKITTNANSKYPKHSAYIS